MSAVPGKFEPASTEVTTMSHVAFDIPPGIALQLGADDRQAGAALRMMAAVKLFELGRLSSGAAAELAGVPQPLFLARLGDYGVAAFDLTEDELAHDLANA
jgi:predicted HTH domain antitoxin